ncbi:MAG: xanthine dehydrogenase family protein subunit M [Candidatus Krumholzibacteria bacterium]|jgi:CO/xanthine dehydrogenase FAD-binding subunit|nr:xanthine dehydrogenase family protein subunit M [Candidatus Krumholzibacteria bacterium]MDP6668627.1 xanthine dehydrogenase family protein subunit M [Candidatus Krumholzibacteria bacterium]MDP6798179.1 xanthine dehydrogenase family protein subunit M [Candidatus Krumholzibacteria bacterium]MDP7022317.1 xanthine dehydrogenase family protein subunit M [Candidatus Krumholzibacteria bacterium]
MKYLCPRTLADAESALAREDALALAGGSDLLVHLGCDRDWPGTLVDLKNLKELQGVESEGGLLRLGAALTVSELADSREIHSFPALKEACRSFAGRQICNRATLGGNLVNASPAADLVPPLITHEAQLVTTRRRMPVEELAVGPGETCLEAGEILLSVELPWPPDESRDFFFKLAPRDAMSISVVSVAGLLLFRDKEVLAARLALGSVAATVIRAKEAERALEGKCLSPDGIRKAASLAAAASSPIDDLRGSASYRREMVERILIRSLLDLVESGENIVGS